MAWLNFSLDVGVSNAKLRKDNIIRTKEIDLPLWKIETAGRIDADLLGDEDMENDEEDDEDLENNPELLVRIWKGCLLKLDGSQ